MRQLHELHELRFDDWTKIVPKGCFVERDEVIVELCTGKTVLHVGAADAPFDLEKGRVGQLLHQKVQRVANSVVGVDIDKDAIASLREIGIQDILEADICEVDPLRGKYFDVVLCCDVIEHVSAPGPLLAACRRYLQPDSKLVVTTMNATALKPALRALANREAVHHDHVAYYSFSTLGKLLLRTGFKLESFGVFAYPTVSRLAGVLTRLIMDLAPASADGIIFEAKVR